MSPIIAIAIGALGAAQPFAEPQASQSHALFVIADNGGGFQAGLFAPRRFPTYLAQKLRNLPVGTTVTGIVYGADAGFYLPCCTPQKVADAYMPLYKQIAASRQYWSQWSQTGRPFDSSPKAGTRLDKALRLVLEDRANWPNQPGSVDVYFMCDGGFDVPKTIPAAEWNAEAAAALKYADQAFDTLKRDRRVRTVHVCLVEQPPNANGSVMRRDKTIVQQWNAWLGVAPNHYVEIQ